MVVLEAGSVCGGRARAQPGSVQEVGWGYWSWYWTGGAFLGVRVGQASVGLRA